MPAAAKTERPLKTRVMLAQTHADPDVRALAEMALMLEVQVTRIDEAIQAVNAALRKLEGDGK